MTFLAEDTLVTVIPNFTLPTTSGAHVPGVAPGGRLACLAGEYGPLRANTPADVPLWAALALRAMHRCRVVPPPWLAVDALAATEAAERGSSAGFEPVPPAYLEVGRQLLTHAREDFDPATYDDVRAGLEALRRARFAKLRDGLAALQGAMAVKLTHISPMEVNAVRPFFLGALNAYARLEDASAAAASLSAAATGGALPHPPTVAPVRDPLAPAVGGGGGNEGGAPRRLRRGD